MLVTSSHDWYDTVNSLFFNYIFVLAALGLSCSSQEICCGRWDLVPWPRIQSGPLLRAHRVLPAGPQGKSQGANSLFLLSPWNCRPALHPQCPLLPSGFKGKTQSAPRLCLTPPCSWTVPSVIQGTREPHCLVQVPTCRCFSGSDCHSLHAFSESSLAKNWPSIPLSSTVDLLLKRADSSFLSGVQKHSRNNYSSTFSCCIPTLVINLR